MRIVHHLENSRSLRVLWMLEELGLVRHTHLGRGAPTYSTKEHKHVHLACHR